MALATAPLRVLETLAGPHGVDRYLELVHPMLAVRDLRAMVTDVRRHRHAVTLTLRPNHRWRGFEAGQYVQLGVDIDGVRHTRCYSPACSQHRPDGRIELTVRSHDGGRVSRYLHEHARPGQVVFLTPAQGDFTLPTPRPDKVLLISGGSGITPVLSMLRTLTDENHPGRIALLHYDRTPDHVGYRAELDAIATAHDNVRAAVVHSSGDAGELAGRFGLAHLDAVAPWWRDAQTYVCGPQSLMTSVRDEFTRCGLEDRVHTESFTLTPVAGDPDGATGTVSFVRSCASAPNSGTPLLEQAEAAGLTPEYGCRMGICFSCTQIKKSGCTRDVRTGELNSDPDTEIQLCINAPVGDVAIDL
jgi:ferredoxin-NADP reductase